MELQISPELITLFYFYNDLTLTIMPYGNQLIC